MQSLATRSGRIVDVIETHNTAKTMTTNTSPVTAPILLRDICSSAGDSDHRPMNAMHANTDPCVAVNSSI